MFVLPACVTLSNGLYYALLLSTRYNVSRLWRRVLIAAAPPSPSRGLATCLRYLPSTFAKLACAHMRACVRVGRRQPAQITLQGSPGHLLGKPNNKTEPSFYMFAGIQLKCD